jgi:hypothetical protein
LPISTNSIVATFLSVLMLCATNSAQLHAAEDVAEAAVRATVRISQGNVAGTGFFVTVENSESGSPRHVLVSAAHVFRGLNGPTGTVALRTKSETGESIRKDTTLKIREGDKPLWAQHPELDVAAIEMPLAPEFDVEPFLYRHLADAAAVETRKVRVGQDVFIPCFPAKVEANSSGWPVLRKGILSTHPLHPVSRVKTMFVDYSHFGGDSGAPVIAQRDQEPLVVGLVFAMLRQTDKSSSTFEERTTHTPLGLAQTVQAAYVRDTIDALLKK